MKIASRTSLVALLLVFLLSNAAWGSTLLCGAYTDCSECTHYEEESCGWCVGSEACVELVGGFGLCTEGSELFMDRCPGESPDLDVIALLVEYSLFIGAAAAVLVGWTLLRKCMRKVKNYSKNDRKSNQNARIRYANRKWKFTPVYEDHVLDYNSDVEDGVEYYGARIGETVDALRKRGGKKGSSGARELQEVQKSGVLPSTTNQQPQFVADPDDDEDLDDLFNIKGASSASPVSPNSPGAVAPASSTAPLTGKADQTGKKKTLKKAPPAAIVTDMSGGDGPGSAAAPRSAQPVPGSARGDAPPMSGRPLLVLGKPGATSPATRNIRGALSVNVGGSVAGSSPSSPQVVPGSAASSTHSHLSAVPLSARAPLSSRAPLSAMGTPGSGMPPGSAQGQQRHFFPASGVLPASANQLQPQPQMQMMPVIGPDGRPVIGPDGRPLVSMRPIGAAPPMTPGGNNMIPMTPRGTTYQVPMTPGGQNYMYQQQLAMGLPPAEFSESEYESENEEIDL